MIQTLARIAVLVAQGKELALRKEFLSARRKRVPFGAIQETILQTYLFAGYPRAINGFWVFRETFPKAPVAWQELRRGSSKARGGKLCRRIYGGDYDAMMRNMRRLHPELAGWILEEGYGKVLSRWYLSPKQRELIVIGMLTAGGIWRQLPSHIKGARHVGAKRPEMEGVLRALKNLVSPSRRDRARRYVRTLFE